MVERERVPPTRTGGRWTRPAVPGGHGNGATGSVWILTYVG